MQNFSGEVSYRSEFLDTVSIFTPDEKNKLRELGRICRMTDLLNEQSLAAALGFHFIYTSARLEGSTITREQTDWITKTGHGARGVSIYDSVMVLNLKTAWQYINEFDLDVSVTTMHEIHAKLASGLIPPDTVGCMKKMPNEVTGCGYHPPGPGPFLKSELLRMLDIWRTIEDPYDRALYLHNNLAYLQYFQDVNKRTARCMQFISMKNDRVMPFLFLDRYVDDDYENFIDGMMSYYREGDYTGSRQLCITLYEHLAEYSQAKTIEKLIGEENDLSLMVIMTRDPDSIRSLKKYGNEKGAPSEILDRCFTVSPASASMLEINTEKCRIFASLPAFFQNLQMSTETAQRIFRKPFRQTSALVSAWFHVC